MFNLISNSMRKRARVMLFLLPILLVSDQLWAKSTKLLILGDSLSAGYGLTQAQSWVSLLQNAWLKSDISVINAAISGETTDGALARLPRLLNQHSPTHVYVELGGNDGLQGHSISKMRTNLSKIIELSQQANTTVILQEMQIPTNYGRRYTELFTQAYQTLADEYDVVLIPFFLADIALNNDLMQADGIHPNAKAQPMIAQSMQQHLKALLLE
ncbi:arylesterase [Paraglaciecola polaris]|uniref:Acyl-CoA thioesterase I n=1 Tax=Paraglaciecola polaris LMG 21857 TaxID=1129793 RepID=K7AGW6_9ALTE|nr:arylesterase [Paraglaciecola polaris]GAC34525.1 acyl-CoA thioesterase I [Paraglaciecola polaris LMG 21857]